MCNGRTHRHGCVRSAYKHSQTTGFLASLECAVDRRTKWIQKSLPNNKRNPIKPSRTNASLRRIVSSLGAAELTAAPGQYEDASASNYDTKSMHVQKETTEMNRRHRSDTSRELGVMIRVTYIHFRRFRRHSFALFGCFLRQFKSTGLIRFEGVLWERQQQQGTTNTHTISATVH